MKNRKNTRRALFSSVISLILCCAMLVGTTFAWFTDSVTSGDNIITAGNLDIELYHSDKNATEERVSTNTALFDDVELWEPGAVVYENFKVANEGNLTLKYQLKLNFTDATTTEDGRTLADVLKVAVVPNGFEGDRAEAKALWESNLVEDEYLATFARSNTLNPKDDKGDIDEYGVVIYWEPTDNDNFYNMKADGGAAKEPLTIKVNVELFATQVEAEVDSFDNTYDDEAYDDLELPDVIAEVQNIEDLEKALQAGKTAKLMTNLTLDRMLDVPADTTAAIDLNGKTLTLTGAAARAFSLRANLGGGFNILGALIISDSATGGKIEIAEAAGGIVVDSDADLQINGGAISVAEGATGVTAIGGASVDVKGGEISGDGDAIAVVAGDEGDKADIKIGADASVKNVDVEDGASADLSYVGEKPDVSGNVNASKDEVASSDAKLLEAIQNASADDLNVITLDTGVYGDIALTLDTFAQKGDIVFKAAAGAKPVIAGTVKLGYRNQGVGAAMWNANVTFEGITFDHAESEKHSVDVGDVKSLTLKNCTIIGDGEYGIGSARGNNTGVSKIVDCTFENTAMQLLGNFATGLVIENCAFNESRINVQAGNSVTVKNCEFTNTLTDANFGDSFYLIRSNSTPITVENCVMNIDAVASSIATEQEKWGILWNRGTTDWTVNNVDINMTGNAMIQTELLAVKTTDTGKINATDLNVLWTNEDGFILSHDGVNTDTICLYEVPADYAEDTVNVPEGVEAIADYAFKKCSNVKTVILPSTVRDLGRGFDESTVEKVVLNEGLESISSRAFKSTTALKEVVFSSTVKTIADNAFQKSGIKEIVIPATVETVGETAFGASMIEKVTFEGNTSIQGYAFRGCTKLREVYLHGADVTFIPSTLNGRDSMWFCNGESNNANVSNIDFYVKNDIVAARVKTAMGAEANNTDVYVVTPVKTADELTTALAAGQSVILTADIDATVGIEVPAGKMIIGNGHTISYVGTDYTYHLVKLNTDAALKNVNFKNYRVKTVTATNGVVTLENVVVDMDNDQNGLNFVDGAGTVKLINVTCKGTKDAAHLDPNTQVQVEYTPYGDVVLGGAWALEATNCDFGSLHGWNTRNGSSVSLTNTTATVFRMHYQSARILYIDGVETAWSESGAIPVAHDVGGCWSVQPAFK